MCCWEAREKFKFDGKPLSQLAAETRVRKDQLAFFQFIIAAATERQSFAAWQMWVAIWSHVAVATRSDQPTEVAESQVSVHQNRETILRVNPTNKILILYRASSSDGLFQQHNQRKVDGSIRGR
jgi:hypothetical protein